MLTDEVRGELMAHLARAIGPATRPAHVVLVPELTKTRYGTIMRRLLSGVLEGRALGDTTSLHDETVIPPSSGWCGAEPARARPRRVEPVRSAQPPRSTQPARSTEARSAITLISAEAFSSP